MRDILNIKSIQNSFWLVSKADFDVRFVFSVVENPGVFSEVEIISEDRDIDVGHVQKVVFCDLCHEISCADFSLSVLIRFRWGFF